MHNHVSALKTLLNTDSADKLTRGLPVDTSALWDLQHLDVWQHKPPSVALPQEVGTLEEMRFLQLSWTPLLRVVPGGPISCLMQLPSVAHVFQLCWLLYTVGSANFYELESLWPVAVAGPHATDGGDQEEARHICSSALPLAVCMPMAANALGDGDSGCRLWRNMNALQWLRISKSNCKGAFRIQEFHIEIS
jgi:hypothetical protein